MSHLGKKQGNGEFVPMLKEGGWDDSGRDAAILANSFLTFVPLEQSTM